MLAESGAEKVSNTLPAQTWPKWSRQRWVLTAGTPVLFVLLTVPLVSSALKPSLGASAPALPAEPLQEAPVNGGQLLVDLYRTEESGGRIVGGEKYLGGCPAGSTDWAVEYPARLRGWALLSGEAN